MRDSILYGDCRETLQQIADSGTRARMCVTSPPYYGLRDYGNEDADWSGAISRRGYRGIGYSIPWCA